MTAHDIQTPATEPEIGAAPEPTHGAEIVVPLNRLKASPRNARKVKHSAAAIEALAASIRAKGVLQAPVVEIERDREGAATGNYLVTIGEGRRQALRMLAKRKAIKRTHPVKVVVDTLNDAHEISLDENITREAMHPADQFEAFRKLAEERGYGPEEIAARFGVSAHVARQRLRLGAAAPELMTAYREGTLTLDLLTAFCVSEDQDRQRQVLEQMGPYTSVFAIRRAMTEAKVRADDRRVGFVGLEAYEVEGGGVLRDLFTEDGGGWLEDPALLDRLVSEKLTVLAEEARQREGWKWAEACAEFAGVAAFGRVYPLAVERSEADAADMAALSEEYDRLISETDAVEVLPPETDARLEAIDRALQAYGPDYDYTPEAKARAGVMVMLGHDGLARFERGLLLARRSSRPRAATTITAVHAGVGKPPTSHRLGPTEGAGSEWTGCLTWKLRVADRPVGALDRPMIHYLKPVRSRYRTASLSLRSRKTAAAELLGWVSGVALAAVVTPPAKTAVLELLTAYRSSALIDWINPQALAATVFILVFFGCTTLLGLGLGALLKVTLLRERLRLSTSSALYPGPGLKGHPRLEP
ncbi:ParB/RepB/Spo0J family partition protein [Brevundimonas diminuta]|uniref:ParB/RepB/Spo0J family partition protein n=1 Tax=Brevundimonas diminuta TaxID=293 RepID=UPI003208DCCE